MQALLNWLERFARDYCTGWLMEKGMSYEQAREVVASW